jgi:hypothetical protein
LHDLLEDFPLLHETDFRVFFASDVVMNGIQPLYIEWFDILFVILVETVFGIVIMHVIIFVSFAQAYVFFGDYLHEVSPRHRLHWRFARSIKV